MTKSTRSKPLTQQDFLRQAMAELGKVHGLDRPLTRDEMCARLGCPRSTFDKWMAPSETDSNARALPQVMWNFVREVIEHEHLKKKAS